MRPQYYEFALVMIAALILIFVVFMVERTIEYYYSLYKLKHGNGTKIIIQKYSTKSPGVNVSKSLAQINNKLDVIEGQIKQLNSKVNALYYGVKYLIKDLKHLNITNKIIYYNSTKVYRYVYYEGTNSTKFDLALQYMENVTCTTKACYYLDKALLANERAINNVGYDRIDLYRLKKDLIVLKSILVTKDQDRTFDKSIIADIIMTSKVLSERKAYQDLVMYSLIAALDACSELNMRCAYVFTLPGEKVQAKNYDLVVEFPANSNIKFVKYVLAKYNITTLPRYISYIN